MFSIDPPKVIVFDFNGTLLDDLHVAYGSVREIFRTYGISCPTLEQYREEISADFMELYYRYGFPRTTTADDLNVIRKKFYQANEGAAQIRADAPATLDWLFVHGFRTAIVSAETMTTLHKYLVQSGLQRKFDFVRAEAWGSKEAKVNAFLQTVQVFGCLPAEMIYLDDTVDGLIAAKNAGVTPVAFINPTGYTSGHRLAEVTNLSIENISELTEHLSSSVKYDLKHNF